MAANFVAVIAAIVLVVASPSGSDTFVVSATIFRSGTIAIFSFANGLSFVASVSAIIGEIAQPLIRYTSVIATFEFSVRVTFRTTLWQFVGTIATIVFAIAKQPFRYATVIRVARATLPTCRAVSLTTYESGLVTIVTAIVVEIAHP